MKPAILEQLAEHVAILAARVAVIEGQGFETFELCNPKTQREYLRGIAIDVRQARALLDKAWESGAHDAHRREALALYDATAAQLTMLHAQAEFIAGGAWGAFQAFKNAGDLVWLIGTGTREVQALAERFAQQVARAPLAPVPQAA